MALSVKIALLAAGVFLLTGMLTGIWKYRWMMRSETHQAPAYVDIAHRASFFYSFASLVIAELARYSPFAPDFLFFVVAVPLALFALTIVQYVRLGLKGQEQTQFAARNLITTWFMYILMAGEIGGVALLVSGFIYTEFTR